MRRPSVKVNLRWPRSTATSTINTCFCFPPGAPSLALERIAIVAHTFRITQIPIAERAAPSMHFTRGFVPWRLSDDGPGASRTVSMGRHPKPITIGDIVRQPHCQLRLISRNRKWPKISPRSPASDLPWPIARRTNCTMAVPGLSAVCAAPNERDIASGATVEFKSTSARSHRRREKFVRTRNENAFLHKALHRAPITSGSQEIHSKLFADRRSMLSQHSAL